MRPGFWNYVASPTFWAVFLLSLLATFLLTPLVIRLAGRVGAVEGVSYRNIHTGRKPLLGGLAIALPFLAVILWSMTNTTGMFQVLQSHRWELIVLAIGTIAIVTVGVIDDTQRLRARYKLLMQVGVAMMVVSAGIVIERINIPFLGVLELDSLVPGLGAIVTLLWIVGIMNAVNLLDGMDGLATGVCLIACLALAFVAAVAGATFVVLLNVALVGSLCAFLRYNWHPARIFLGDTGSLFLGFALATISVMGSYKAAGGTLLLASAMALGLPIFETLMSMLRRFAGGLPIFAPDSRHTHHRLLRQGLSQRQAAMMLYAVGMVFLVASVAASVLTVDSIASLIPVGIFLAGVVGITIYAGYTRSLSPSFTKRRQETLRRVLFSRYAALSLNVKHTRHEIECILSMTCFELHLNYIEVRLGVHALPIASVPPGSTVQEEVRGEEKLESLIFNTSNGEQGELRYRHSRDTDEIERHTVAICLAQIFEHARTQHFQGERFTATSLPMPAESQGNMSSMPRQTPAPSSMRLDA